MKEKGQKHPYSSFFKRAIYSFFLILAILLIGTIGLHYIENYSYSDAFYFMSMIATGEGPTLVPKTFAGKMFASVMAFISVGTVIAASIFLFGPFLGRLMKVGEEKFKEEEQAISDDFKRFRKDI